MNESEYFLKHRWDICEMCGDHVTCGKCGNNCCNGGYGEIIGPEPGTLIQCDACPSAYDLQSFGYATFEQGRLTPEEFYLRHADRK